MAQPLCVLDSTKRKEQKNHLLTLTINVSIIFFSLFFIQSSPKKNSSLCLFFGCMVTNLFLLWVTQVSQGWISPLTWFPPNSVMNNSLTCFSHVLNEFYSKRGKYRSLPMIDFHLCSPFFSYFDFSFILFPFL